MDDDLPSSRRFLRLYKTNVRNFRSLYIPHALSYGLCCLWEQYSDGRKASCPRLQSEALARELEENTLQQREARQESVGCPECRWRRRSTAASKATETRKCMLKIGIVGCGKIADSHASQIQRIEGCEIVGVCDREPLMARQIYERFPVKRYFSDLDELLTEASRTSFT